MENEDDYETDDILRNYKGRKDRKNSKDKGKRGELQLCKLLTDRFSNSPLPTPHCTFNRVVGSGNRWSHVQYVSKDYIGDIVCPNNFLFSIECKFGYPEIDLHSIINKKCKILDGFLKQAVDDAERSAKYPLLCWKKDRHPWVVFYNITADIKPKVFLKYDRWTCTTLNKFLEMNDEFFFTTEQK